MKISGKFILKVAGTLTVIALVVAALLGVVNNVTKDKIAEQDAENTRIAMSAVAPEGSEFGDKLDITENYRNSFAYSGGLVGGAEYVSFTDITTNVAVTAKKGSAPYPWSYVGGFAGTVKNADFLRCVNNGTVTTDGDYVSGFAAKSETTAYTSCVNNGAITGRTKIGGFGGAVKSTKTVDSYNTGTIGLAAYNGGNQGIGGLFGEIPQFQTVRLGHVRETRAEALVVGADERVRTHHVDEVGEEHQGARRKLPVDAAAGVGQHHLLHAQQFQDIERVADFLHRVAFIKVEPSFQRIDLFLAQLACQQRTFVACYCRHREIRNVFIGQFFRLGKVCGQITKAGAEHHRDFRAFGGMHFDILGALLCFFIKIFHRFSPLLLYAVTIPFVPAAVSPRLAIHC